MNCQGNASWMTAYSETIKKAIYT